MLLLDLPNEVLVHIIYFLGNHDIDCLARTLNTTITPICLSFLRDWLSYTHNERKMIDIFGAPRAFDQDGIFEEIVARRQSELGGLKFSAPPEEPVIRLRVLDYLNLNGDLHWLKKHEIFSDYKWGRLRFDPSAESLTALEMQCRKLGLTLPSGFQKLNANVDFHDWLVPADGSWADFGPVMRYVTPDIDGYVHKIRTDFEYMTYYLFLSPQGSHCVLSSEVDLQDLCGTSGENEDKLYEVGHNDKDSLCLEATSLEEFLVRTYFERWARWINYKAPKAIPENLKQYIIRVFTEEGRKLIE